MSDNTQASGGSHKSLFRRGLNKDSVSTSSIKNGLSNISGKISSMGEGLKNNNSKVIGKMGNRNAPVFTKGVRELDHNGFERYNIGTGTEVEEIYISVNSDRALFNEGQPILQRASDGGSVGSTEVQYEPMVNKVEDEPNVDPRTFFGHNARSDADTEFTAVIGTVDDGQIVPKKIDTSFLGKIAGSGSGSNSSSQPRIIIEDVPEVQESVQETVEVIEELEVEEVPVVEDVRETLKSVEDEVSEEFFVMDDDSDVIIVASTDEDEIEEELVADIVEEPVIEEASQTFGFTESVEESVVEAEDLVADIVEEPVIETCVEEVSEELVAEVPEDLVADIVEEPVIETCVEEVSEELVAEVPEDLVADIVEEPVIEETPQTFGFIEAVAEEPIVEEISVEEPAVEIEEQPVEAPMVAVMSVPAISGLIIEGEEEPVSQVETGHVEYETTGAEKVAEATSSEATPTPKCTIDSEGEGRPKMSPPKVCFKFINGRLVKVENDKPVESQEGLPRPLDGQA